MTTNTEQALREVLRRIKSEAVSLADAQVLALEALALSITPPAASPVPAVPQGEPEAYMVYGNYTRQPFRSIESAQAYMGGLLKSDPEGGYHIRPLFYTTPAAPSQEPGTCAQCKKPYRNGANTKGCPKCAPGLVVPESEFQKSISAQAPGTLTDEEKWSEFENRFIDAMREKEQA